MYICNRCGKEWKDEEANDNDFFCVKKCGGKLTEKTDTVEKKRLFISYGRDKYAFVAERVKNDLTGMGYTVWFDKDKLKGSEDWEEYIEEGIRNATEGQTKGRVIFMVTPHSARKPEGYCLNELAMALRKGAKIIPVMLVESEVPLSIARIQYLDIRDCIGSDGTLNEELYQAHLKRLIEAIDHDRLNYEGVQAKLINALEPLEFSVDILLLLQDFTGRLWVFEEIEKWMSEKETSKVFWLTGAPGVGKSAISAWLRENERPVKAFHFCLHNDTMKKSPVNLVKSIAYQLATQIPAYMEKLGAMDIGGIVREYPDAGTLFKALIVEPMHRDIPEPEEPIVILIDGLDEATENRRNRIAEFIRDEFHKTPEWLKLFITSRPGEPELNGTLSAIKPHRLETQTRKNLEDIQQYLEDTLKRKLEATQDTAAILEKLLEKSEGVFLYATWVAKDIMENRWDLERADEFPIGLAGVYKKYFERVYPDVTEYRNFSQNVLGIILAAYEPLSVSLIAEIMGCREVEVRNLCNDLGSLLAERDKGIEVFHGSVADWLRGAEYSGHYMVSVADGHRAIIKKGLSQYDRKKINNYYLEFLPLHLMENGEQAKCVELLTDFVFIMERVKAGHLERVLTDYRNMEKIVDKEIRKRMTHWTAFFRDKAHILRCGDEEWPSHKILFQLAMEHADESPVTLAAENWFESGACGWAPLIRLWRPHKPASGPMRFVNAKGCSWKSDHAILIETSDELVELDFTDDIRVEAMKKRSLGNAETFISPSIEVGNVTRDTFWGEGTKVTRDTVLLSDAFPFVHHMYCEWQDQRVDSFNYRGESLEIWGEYREAPSTYKHMLTNPTKDSVVLVCSNGFHRIYTIRDAQGRLEGSFIDLPLGLEIQAISPRGRYVVCWDEEDIIVLPVKMVDKSTDRVSWVSPKFRANRIWTFEGQADAILVDTSKGIVLMMIDDDEIALDVHEWSRLPIPITGGSPSYDWSTDSCYADATGLVCVLLNYPLFAVIWRCWRATHWSALWRANTLEAYPVPSGFEAFRVESDGSLSIKYVEPRVRTDEHCWLSFKADETYEVIDDDWNDGAQTNDAVEAFNGQTYCQVEVFPGRFSRWYGSKGLASLSLKSPRVNNTVAWVLDPLEGLKPFAIALLNVEKH